MYAELGRYGRGRLVWPLVKWSVLILVAAAYVLLGAMYWQSSNIISQPFTPQDRQLTASVNPDQAQAGQRLAQLYGCTRCHGDRLQGKVLEEGVLTGRIVAPNLTGATAQYSLKELESLVRQGIRTDGTSLFGMPAGQLSLMSDRDFTTLAAYLQSIPGQVNEPGRSRYGLLTRYRIYSGQWPPAAASVSDSPWPEGYQSEPLLHGQYLSRLSCEFCHSPRKFGQPATSSELSAAGGYDRLEFKRLLRTGQLPDGRVIKSKADSEQGRFALMTEVEMNALYIYLLSYDGPN